MEAIYESGWGSVIWENFFVFEETGLIFRKSQQRLLIFMYYMFYSGLKQRKVDYIKYKN